ncbi:MAG TPA: multiheme c-type cytochrome [Isosphaeraceae bacterium]|nr:multiheme c-type cytochrome [Isosphaeraceae bacterium]
MPLDHSRKSIAMLCAACLPAFTLLLGALGPSEVPQQAAASPAQAGTRKSSPPQNLRYSGVRFCIGCHSQKGQYDDDYVQLTEYTTWSTEDKHSLAYVNLLGQRGKRMGETLGFSVTEDRRCLSCHGLANIPANQRASEFHKENGVSCEGCHGPAQNWGADHSSKDWRLLTFQEKQSKGMVNVRDPVERTRNCATCHVGSVQEGKVVTHEMYAAGHPPLPGFEIATFSESLPRHWRLRKDVPYLRDSAPDEVKRRFDYANARFENTKLVVISAAVIMRESMALLEGRASARAPATGSSKDAVQLPGWPDYAQFDCYACHHDLKVPSWRQARGYAGAPGRPQVRPWPLALVELAVRFTAPSEEAAREQLAKLRAARQNLEQAFSAQPFGNPDQVRDAASKIKAWSDDLISRADALNLDASAAVRLLKTLCAMANERVPDYDSARQLAWAFQRIYTESNLKLASGDEARSILEALEQDLHLPLNAAREPRKALISKKSPAQALPESLQELSNKELAESLRHIADYSPERFQKAMKRLAELLPAR